MIDSQAFVKTKAPNLFIKEWVWSQAIYNQLTINMLQNHKFPTSKDGSPGPLYSKARRDVTPPSTLIHRRPSGQVSQTVWHTFAILRIKSRQTPLFEPGSATFCRTGYRFRARPILPIMSRSIRRPEGPTRPPSRGTEGVCPLGGGREAAGGGTAVAAVFDV